MTTEANVGVHYLNAVSCASGMPHGQIDSVTHHQDTARHAQGQCCHECPVVNTSSRDIHSICPSLVSSSAPYGVGASHNEERTDDREDESCNPQTVRVIFGTGGVRGDGIVHHCEVCLLRPLGAVVCESGSTIDGCRLVSEAVTDDMIAACR